MDSPGTDRPRARHGCRFAATALASLLLVLAALLALATDARAELSPTLEARLAGAGANERVAVIATLAEQVDSADYADRPRAALLRALRETAGETQGEVVETIDVPVRRFWLVNALALSATPDELRELAADRAVARVDLDATVRVADGAQSSLSVPAAFQDPGGEGSWGLSAIGMPAAWSAYRLDGTGVRVGSIDTGVDPANPELAGKIVAWRDFVAGRPDPYDDNGHGTHTIGTMVGRGVPGLGRVGVAPGATAVVAKAIGPGGAGSGSLLLAAAQWMTDPDGDPATADYPTVINNSWSGGEADDAWFRPMVRQWVALGIVPVFAVGNTGPGPRTIGSPASYPEVIAVAATDPDGRVSDFSSRGPVVWSNPDGTGPEAGTPLTKPDLSAPGEGIVSSVGTGYAAYSGSSMAAPHVAGVVALLRQGRPELAVVEIADILRRTATDIGPPGPDPEAGAGLLSAPSALAVAIGAAPETRFASTPPALSASPQLVYTLAPSQATGVRGRVDDGGWSAVTPGASLTLEATEGTHEIEVQAVSADAVVDATPERHSVTVDLTAPSARVIASASGSAVTFSAHVSDALSGPAAGGAHLWRFSDGATASGQTVTHRFAAGTRRAGAELVAADLAGNTTVATSALILSGSPTSPIRSVSSQSRVSRRAPGLVVHGRLASPARVRASLHRLPATRGLRTAAARPTSVRVRASEVARSSRTSFRLTVPLERVAPGAYRLRVSALDAVGRPIGAPVTRTVRVTR